MVFGGFSGCFCLLIHICYIYVLFLAIHFLSAEVNLIRSCKRPSTASNEPGHFALVRRGAQKKPKQRKELSYVRPQMPRSQKVQPTHSKSLKTYGKTWYGVWLQVKT